MAEGCLKSILREEGLDDLVEVTSAGTAGANGMRATTNAVEACSERGIDISNHRSRGLTRHMISSADLVLAMELGHARFAEHMLPAKSSKVFLLGGDEEILDPIGGTMQMYKETLEKIDACFREKWLTKIRLQLEEGEPAK